MGVIGRLSAAWSRIGKQKAPHQGGALARELLSDISSNGESEHVHFGKAQGVYEVGSAIGHRLDGIRRFSARPRNTGIVEKNDRSACGKTVGDRRIPMIHAGSVMGHEDEWDSGRSAETSIGKAYPVLFDELGGGRDMGKSQIGHLSPQRARLPACVLSQVSVQEFICSLVGERRSGGIVVRAIVPREGVILPWIAVDGRVRLVRKGRLNRSLRGFGNELVLLAQMH